MIAPTVPALARLDRVELAKTGTWSIAVGGEQRFTRQDFAAAITAMECPAVGRPIVKLGHLDERGPGLRPPGGSNDGEPALGWVMNVGVTNEGNTLRGDLVGMPAWLGQIAASAYPSRSIEGARNYRCSIGHLHPFVISAVALLGITPPGVGTLTSLQDHVRALYGVAASTDTDTPGGEPFAVTFQEVSVPKKGDKPAGGPVQPFAAAVSVDDIRDAFYDGAPSNLWIVEVQVSPPQLIVTSSDDADATYRIPYMLNGDDDDESVTFGTPVPVEVVYQDTAPDPSEVGPVGVAAAAGEPTTPPVRRAVIPRPSGGAVAKEQRRSVVTVPVAAADGGPDDNPSQGAPIPQTDPMQAPTEPPAPPTGPTQPAEPDKPPAQPVEQPAAEPEPTNKQEGDDMSLSGVRSRLGLPDDADEAAVLAALDELKTKADTPAEPPAELVAAAAKATKQSEQFAAALGQIQTLSEELAAVKAEKAAEKKTAFFAAAISQGKIAPADRESWEKRYDRDADLVAEILGAIKPGTAVPVAAAGYTGDPEPAVSDDDLLELLSPAARGTGSDQKAGV